MIVTVVVTIGTVVTLCKKDISIACAVWFKFTDHVQRQRVPHCLLLFVRVKTTGECQGVSAALGWRVT